MSNHESRWLRVFPWVHPLAMPGLVLAAATLLFAAACADEPVAPLDTHPDPVEAEADPSFAMQLTCAVDVAAGAWSAARPRRAPVRAVAVAPG